MIVSRIEVLERLVPTATVLELDVQMIGVEPEHRDGGQEFSGLSRFSLLLLRTDRLRPTFIDAVAEAQSAVVTESQHGFAKILVHHYGQQAPSKRLFTSHSVHQAIGDHR